MTLAKQLQQQIIDATGADLESIIAQRGDMTAGAYLALHMPFHVFSELEDIYVSLIKPRTVLSDDYLATAYPQLVRDIAAGVAGKRVCALVKDTDYHLHTDTNCPYDYVNINGTVTDVFDDYEKYVAYRYPEHNE